MIIIEAKRWFDRKWGNTYHSCAVFKDGELVGRVPFTYGYDEQYLQTALEIMQSAKIFPKTDERLQSGISKDWYDFREDMRNNRKNYHTTVSDVGRKKDL
jgi:hypothetical protein